VRAARSDQRVGARHGLGALSVLVPIGNVIVEKRALRRRPRNRRAVHRDSFANRASGVFSFICSARTTPVSVFVRFALFLVDRREGFPFSAFASRA
jgi:hypothetical protein